MGCLVVLLEVKEKQLSAGKYYMFMKIVAVPGLDSNEVKPLATQCKQSEQGSRHMSEQHTPYKCLDKHMFLQP